MRYFIELSYNGKEYHGWQIQPNAISVQEVIEKALTTLLQVKTEIVGAGRTDAGVHAKQMFAHFDTEKVFEDKDLVYKLNSFLPNDIAIKTIFKVKNDAHARFDATARTYHYRIATHKNPFSNDFTFTMQKPLDIERMNDACKALLQYNDFQCFSKSNTDVKTYHCKIETAFWQLQNEELVFTIKADRFLRNMVRAIVGTMINIGKEAINIEDLHRIIKSKDRSEAGFSVPAYGLYLAKVDYPSSFFENRKQRIENREWRIEF